MLNSNSNIQSSSENDLKSLRILSAIGIIVGSWSLIFDIYFFREFLLEIYFARVLLTIIALIVFVLSYREVRVNIYNLLMHILIISLIGSFVFTIYKIPQTVYINSQILSLLIFTTAIIFNWETKNQIIVAIYYNLLFAASIMYNDVNLYLLPNILSLVLFVCLISLLSVAASFINYNLRKKYKIRSEEIDFLFNNAPVGICSTDIEGNILTCNKYLANILGVEHNTGKCNLSEILTNPVFKEYFNKVKSSADESEECIIDYINNSTPKYFRISSKKIINEVSEHVIEFIFIDETKEILAAKELQKAGEKLLKETKEKEQSAQKAILEKNQKIELLARINHEVRTPLNSILLYFDMVNDGVLQSFHEVKEYSKIVKIAAQSLLNTINNFIDYAKIETGKHNEEIELFNLCEDTESIVQFLMPLATNKNNELIFINNNRCENVVYTDSTKYRQIITNLIANAIKFTSNGIIKVVLDNTHKEGDNYEITAFVEDTGPGISEDELKTIFNPFISLKNGHRTNYNSGLGLTICTEFLQILKGTITVESSVGEGTKFTIKIPYNYHYN